MENNQVENVENVKETKEVTKKRLSAAATILITVTATLGAIVLARIMYFFISGN